VYRALGADLAPSACGTTSPPRDGKTPVAFTTFGGRRPIVPWVFATYRTGGLDNLNELLHETGHAIHLAAIRTRPAYTDWPDADPFTEAVADFIALDVYEPAWQQRWLGDSVPLADGLRDDTGPSCSTCPGRSSSSGCCAIRRPIPTWSGPASPRTTSISGRIPSSPGGPCAGQLVDEPGT
jgi:hypothetical protein